MDFEITENFDHLQLDGKGGNAGTECRIEITGEDNELNERYMDRRLSSRSENEGLYDGSSKRMSTDFLSPYAFSPRGSLSSASDYSLRRRRPITLQIMPRLSLPGRSTSAPATADSDWPNFIRSFDFDSAEAHICVTM
ncbi:uncharacterized protein LOC142333387 [Lycorma delicatula]|uniref:uncharacterized protein LOC142333387 n=1 Tax=Lycorma delicatula TaxID=130591 RepID=UPI003F5111DE